MKSIFPNIPVRRPYLENRTPKPRFPRYFCAFALKIGRRSSRSLEYCRMWLFYVVVSNERQRNEQRIITHAYTAIVLVAAAVVVYLFNSLELHKRQNNEQSNEYKANESPTKKKTAESAENISATKIKTNNLTF